MAMDLYQLRSSEKTSSLLMVIQGLMRLSCAAFQRFQFIWRKRSWTGTPAKPV
ncbi:MAG: hypothetical protein QXU45_00325 [Candidatus Bathyarchaeia archaeon]